MNNFFSKFTGFHNSITAAIASLAAFYAVSPGFRDWIGALLTAYQQHVPSLLQPIPALAVALYMWHHNGQSSNQTTNPLGVGGQKGFARISALLLMIAIWCIGTCLLIATGCRHVNSNNPAVIRVVTLLDAENTVNTVAHGLADANTIVNSLSVSEPEYYEYVHPKLVQMAKLNEQANQKILAAKNGDTTVDWRSAVTAVGQVVSDPQSLVTFGFKNPKSQQYAQDGIAALIGAINTAQAFGGN